MQKETKCPESSSDSSKRAHKSLGWISDLIHDYADEIELSPEERRQSFSSEEAEEEEPQVPASSIE